MENYKNGPIPAFLCLLSSFSHDNFNKTNWKKPRWCAWNSNPGCRMLGTDETTERWHPPKNWKIIMSIIGQWLWRSWQSSHFRYQRTRVRIQSSATFIEHLFTVNCVEKTKIKRKRGREWPILKKHQLVTTPEKTSLPSLSTATALRMLLISGWPV